jgi:hypothetical protein
VSDKERELLNQLIGWRRPFVDNFNLTTPVGWLLTILAVSMGAPFWFDILNKVMNVRYAGKSPDEKPREPEKPESTTPRV